MIIEIYIGSGLELRHRVCTERVEEGTFAESGLVLRIIEASSVASTDLWRGSNALVDRPTWRQVGEFAIDGVTHCSRIPRVEVLHPIADGERWRSIDFLIGGYFHRVWRSGRLERGCRHVIDTP
ncbi:hypothetical protein [Aquabacterium humicola]|uniref:hypothetical protein n=1 Tax=Aquabacterium humicola TaxID=3237377 RepID=UPI0025426C2A|nr:hypothetical protein [Rubrivivax pictus]